MSDYSDGLTQEHRDLAREAVRKSLVLLKNGKPGSQPLLPLQKNAPKILVAGTHADNLGLQCGGWTITWQGSSGQTTAGMCTIPISICFCFTTFEARALMFSQDYIIYINRL